MLICLPQNLAKLHCKDTYCAKWDKQQNNIHIHCLTRQWPVNVLLLIIYAAYLVNMNLNSHVRTNDIFHKIVSMA